MAKFKDCIKTIMRHEGGYTVDHAGPTNYGVTLPVLKRMGVYGDIDHDGDVDHDDIRAMTPAHAKATYKKLWWDRYKYSAIESNIVATKVFTFSVNMGSKQAHLIVQRACNACTQVMGNKHTILLVEDGIIGPKTRARINAMTPAFVSLAISCEAAGFYRYLAGKNNKKYGKFLKGWLKRAYE